MRRNSNLLLRGALALVFLLTPVLGRTQGVPGHPDAPAKPQKGEYTWEEPKDWTPPTLQQLHETSWTEGKLATSRQLAKERAATMKPEIGEQDALKLKNDSDEANVKIIAALSRVPKSEDEVDWEAEVNLRAEGAPNTLNPVFFSSEVESNITGGLFAAPLIFDHTMELMGDAEILKQWRRAPTMDMLVLRDDLTWDDGEPFTAYDIEFSYHVIMDQRINVTAVRSGTDELKWVKAYDPQTLVVFHKEPLATNALNVGFPIIPKHIFSPGLADDPTMRVSDWNVYWNLHPLSSGPYVLREHQSNQYVLLERRDSWYQDKSGKQIRDKPYVKSFRFRIIPDDNTALLSFKKGELDEKRLLARQWVNDTNDEAFAKQGVKAWGKEWGYNYMGWSQRPVPDAPFFKDKRVRLAMSLAFDYKEYVEKLAFNLVDPGNGPFHPESWMANPEVKPMQQDLDRAEELLDEAGWTDTDGDGIRDKTVDGKKVPFEFTMTVSQGGSGELTATLMKENLEGIGVRMNIKVLEWATFAQAQDDHQLVAYAAAWGTGIDPDTAKNLWKTGEYEKGRNYVAYSNLEVDRLFDEGARKMTREERAPIYQKIDKLIADDQPYTFMAFRRTMWAFSKRLRGYNFSPRNPWGTAPGYFGLWVPKAS